MDDTTAEIADEVKSEPMEENSPAPASPPPPPAQPSSSDTAAMDAAIAATLGALLPSGDFGSGAPGLTAGTENGTEGHDRSRSTSDDSPMRDATASTSQPFPFPSSSSYSDPHASPVPVARPSRFSDAPGVDPAILEPGRAAALAFAARAKSAAPVSRVAQLTARVESDPLDGEARLALLADAEQKGDLERTREVYEDFLKVFPDAVSPCPRVWRAGELTLAAPHLVFFSRVRTDSTMDRVCQS